MTEQDPSILDVISGEASQIDTAGPFSFAALDEDDNWAFDIDALPGGASVTAWAYDTDGDYVPDGIVFRTVDANGAGVTFQVGLKGLPGLAAAVIDEDFNASVEPLPGGGHALTYVTSAPASDGLGTFLGPALIDGTLYRLLMTPLGVPASFRLLSPPTSGGDFVLIGLDNEGNRKVLPISSADGLNFTVTQAMLDEFSNDSRLLFAQSGITTTMPGLGPTVQYSLRETMFVAGDSPLVDVPVLVTPGSPPAAPDLVTAVNYATLTARAEVFHVDGWDNQGRLTLSIRAADYKDFLYKLGWTGGAGQFTAADGSVFTVSGLQNGMFEVLSLRLENVQVVDGMVRVPQLLLDVLGENEAAISLSLTLTAPMPAAALDNGTLPTVTIEGRQTAERPDGYFLQLLDDAGLAVGEPVRIDSDSLPFEHNSDDPPFIKVDVLPDGRIVAFWQVADPSGENPAIAVQNLSADGTKLGEPVLLAIPQDIVDSLRDAEMPSFALEALSGGGYAMTAAIVPQAVQGLAGGFTQTSDGQFVLVTGAGRPTFFDLGPGFDPEATLELRGLDNAGNPVSQPVTLDGAGRIVVTQDILDQFANDGRIALFAQSSQPLSVWPVQYGLEKIWSYPAGSTEQDSDFSVTVADNGSAIIAQGLGRSTRFDLDGYTVADGASLTASLIVLAAQTTDLPGKLGVHQPGVPVFIDGQPVILSQSGPNDFVLILPAVPSPDGIVEVPAFLQAALGSDDATIIMVAQNLVPGSTASGTVSNLAPAEVAEGFYLQLFAADGQPAGTMVRLDGPTVPVAGNLDAAGLFDIDERPDGSLHVSWLHGGNGDLAGEPGIAIQHVDAGGNPLGDVIVLENIAPEFRLALADGSFMGKLAVLDDGSFMLTGPSGVEQRWWAGNSTTLEPGVQVSGGSLGKPAWFDIPAGQPGQADWTFNLRALGEDGQVIRVAVAPDGNGRIAVTREHLDQFPPDARISLEIRGVAAGQAVQVHAERRDIWTYADGNATIEEHAVVLQLQPNLNLLSAPEWARNMVYTSFTSTEGRAESFDIGLVSPTPNAPTRVLILNIAVGDVYALAAQLGLPVAPPGSSAPPVQRDGASWVIRADMGSGSGVLQILYQTPPANGVVAVPPAVIAALGSMDAAISLVTTGYTLDASHVATVTYREATVLRDGLLVQQFDPLGHARVSGLPQIDGETIEGGTAFANLGQLADANGIAAIALQWQRSFDGGQTWEDISGATTEAYDVTAGDRGALLRLRAVVTDGLGLDEVRYSRPQEIVSLEGDSGDDRLVGSAADDFMQGHAGNDTIAGRSGNDAIYADEGDDSVAGEGGNDTLRGGDGRDTLTGGDGNDHVAGETGDDSLMGGAGNDMLEGGAGNDDLSGDGGNDTIVGGDGNNRADGGDGNDVIRTGRDADRLTGGAGNDTLQAGAGEDQLDGGTGADQMWGGAGNDVYRVDHAGDTVIETTTLTGSIDAGGRDTVIATADVDLGGYNGARHVEEIQIAGDGAVNATGNAMANTILGNAAANVLNGGGGIDTMTGGAGNDIYVIDQLADVIVEDAGGGFDTVRAGFNLTLGANLEGLELTGSENLAGTGNAGANRLVGNSGNNLLLGSGGDDTLVGGAGRDTLDGGAGNDTFEIVTGHDADSFIGGIGTDRIVATANGLRLSFVKIETVEEISGNGFEDFRIVGTAAADTMSFSAVQLNGVAAIDGGAGNDTITGSTGNDTLVGGEGIDRLSGGTGDDTYVIELSATGTLADAVADGGGIDTLRLTGSFSGSTASLTLASALEHVDASATGASPLNLNGNSLANRITGNAFANAISGGSGNDTMDGDAGDDTLNGGTGDDSMTGGAGHDTYVVDSPGDIVVETADGGLDTVRVATAAAYLAPENVEIIQSFASAVALNATGNAAANMMIGSTVNDRLDGADGNDSLNAGLGNDTLAGGQGDDTLDGGSGNDSMTGGNGNDVYFVNSLGDAVVELAGGGVDTILTAITPFSLAGFAEIENLAYTGTGGASFTGNGLDNRLTGNSGNDTLNGGGGADTLVGQGGGDTYHVDNAGDVIVEEADGGFDRVNVTLSDYVLPAHVEALFAAGPAGAAFTGTGNALANLIGGGTGADTLAGGEGNDTLQGGLGNDDLRGGAGDDRFEIGAMSGADAIDGGDGHDAIVATIANATLRLSTFSGIERIDAGANAGFRIVGQASNETLDFSAIELINVASIDAGAGNDVLIGAGSHDNLIGNSGNDSVEGRGGNDLLEGGFGNDSLSGDSGADTILGGGGRDIMAGGSDADVFRFTAITDSSKGANADVISDFAAGSDLIDLSAIDPKVDAGDQAYLFIGDAAFAASGLSQVRVVISGGDALVQLDHDGNGTSDMEILVNGASGLGAADFVL